MFIPGVLKRFDLPQVAGALADRSLALLSPLDPMKQPVEIPEVLETYQWTRQAYAGAQAGGRFRILRHEPELDLSEQYRRALEF